MSANCRQLCVPTAYRFWLGQASILNMFILKHKEAKAMFMLSEKDEQAKM